MSEYRGSYDPDADPSQADTDITWSDLSCFMCERPDVVWTYRLSPGPSAPKSFALPRRCYLCEDCHALLEQGAENELADRFRTHNGDWPTPEEAVHALREALAGEAVHR